MQESNTTIQKTPSQVVTDSPAFSVPGSCPGILPDLDINLIQALSLAHIIGEVVCDD